MGTIRHCGLLLLVLAIGIRADEVSESNSKAPVENSKNAVETGKLYFTGTGYTVNLIPHAIVLGLLTFAVIFLYGDSLFGSDVSTGYGAPTSSYGAPEASYGAPEASYGAPAASYGAPAPAYGAPSYAANRYYDPYAADAATALADAYNPEVNPYNVETPETALG